MEEIPKSQTRSLLKALLYHLAKESEHPAEDLRDLLQEVLVELHDQVKEAIQPKRRLKLVSSAEN